MVHSSKNEATICAIQQEKDGPLFKLHVRGKIDYRNSTLWADEATYNSDTGDVTLAGHVVLDGGTNDEHIEASHGTYNVGSETGRFYDVIGTIGYRQRASRLLLISSNPFAFTGKIVDKTGPDHYVVHDGTVTTCKPPHPKWQFNTHRAVVTAGDNALVYFSTFRIRGIPILYFPFATHPLEQSKRESGFLMPRIGRSSTKGTILGDSFYWAINRSMDAEIGAESFSSRGWAPRGDFRARPSSSSYLNMNYFGVMDRGLAPPRSAKGVKKCGSTPRTGLVRTSALLPISDQTYHCVPHRNRIVQFGRGSPGLAEELLKGGLRFFHANPNKASELGPNRRKKQAPCIP